MNENIRQNLIDAGCDDKFIEEFASCICDEKQCEKMLVFINAGCKFQDQGGIWIGDGV